MPDALTLWSLAVLAIGGLLYLAMSRTSSHGVTRLAIRRPGWIARRRARGGITHKRDRVGVGYTSATRSVHLSARELAHHGAVFGGPGSGKTTFLQLLVEAAAGRMPVVVVDPKGSPALEQTVRAHGGQVWTLDGTLPADLLDPRPWQVPDLLLEAEDYAADARAYRDAAHQRALWAAWALALNERPMDLAALRRLLERGELVRALEPLCGRDERIADWLQRLTHPHGGIEDSGARGLDRSLGTLLDGVAMRGSLRACPEALRLEDVMDTNGLVLFSLDVADYPHATRKIAAWVLLAMARLARTLAGELPAALLLVDEVGALGSSARHLRGLVGRARESGLAVVLATQGPSDLEAVDRALLPQVLQDTAWQLVFRQGSPHDARQVEALFGQAWIEDLTRWSDGRSSSRHVERPRVSVDEWMNALEPGDAWLRVAPIDKGWRQHRVRVALPRRVEPTTETAVVHGRVRIVTSDTGSDSDSDSDSDSKATSARRQYPNDVSERDAPPSQAALAAPPPQCPEDLLERIGVDVTTKVEQRQESRRELGPCLVWTGAQTTDSAGRTYGRLYDRALGRTDYTHRVVWRRCYGAIPPSWTVDHLCDVTLCQRPDHLELTTKTENTRRRHQRARTTAEPSVSKTVQRFAVTLYARVDRPTVDARSLTLDELVRLLSRFEVLVADKRRGRCWSPTAYLPGHTTRGNAGVAAVSALVFDLDRVPPDPERLGDVYWIGHTTWSHTPQAPRWRVVIPLERPVPAREWSDVWRRARAALCPEADPACKDPSRAYWLPSHNGGVAAKTRRHEGVLLDPSTLPQLPLERRSPVRQQVPARGDRRGSEAYMAQVLANLASVQAGGRNAALNHAAWTLGRWVVAGVLEQRDVEDQLYVAAEQNGLVADDGDRQCWATIRSGLSAGLLDSKQSA